MSFNGAGLFSINSSGQPVVAATTITAATFNAFTADIATGLSTCLLKDGTQTVTANIPLGGYKITGLGSGLTSRTDAARTGDLQDGTATFVAAGGTADAITATFVPAIAAVVDGMLLAFRATGANTTTTPTFSPNGLTARTIVKQGGQALAVGDIRAANHDCLVRYRATGTVWELLNPATGSPVAAITSGTITGITNLVATGGQLTGITNLVATGGTITGITDIVVADGGTGASTFTDAGVLIGNGTGAIQVTSAGTAGQVLTSNGAGVDPTFQTGGGFTLGTPQATTSGTSFNFGSIPAGTKQIIVSLQGVSLSGTDNLLVQLGDAGGIETTGYLSTSMNISAAVSSTAGFIMATGGATGVWSGSMTLTLLNSSTFLWVAGHTGKSGSANGINGGGDKALSAELTQLTLLATGSDTFDAGSVNIMYIG